MNKKSENDIIIKEKYDKGDRWAFLFIYLPNGDGGCYMITYIIDPRHGIEITYDESLTRTPKQVAYGEGDLQWKNILFQDFDNDFNLENEGIHEED